jgi:hypothetical protein
MNNMEATEAKRVTLSGTKEIELPRIDISQYIGNKAKIERVDEFEGKYGFYAKVETVVLDTLQRGQEPIELRASRIFGLYPDAQGTIGWSKESKLGQFLKKMHVAHYRELVGKEVVVQSLTNKDGQDFLTFN